jgi:hypothetical protein
MCPHTTICVLKLQCVLILLYMCVLILLDIRPHATYYICVLILLHMCPHTTMPGGACIPSRAYAPQMSPALRYMCPHTTTHVSSYYYICVLILLHMCPHTTAYVSSYYYARWSVYTKPRVCAANVVVELIPVLQAMVCKTVYVS